MRRKTSVADYILNNCVGRHDNRVDLALDLRPFEFEPDEGGTAAEELYKAILQWQALVAGLTAVPTEPPMVRPYGHDGDAYLHWEGTLPLAEALLLGTRIAHGPYMNVLAHTRHAGETQWRLGAPWSPRPLCRARLSVLLPAGTPEQVRQGRSVAAELTHGFPAVPAPTPGSVHAATGQQPAVCVEFDTLYESVWALAGRLVSLARLPVQLEMQYLADRRTDRPAGPWYRIACTPDGPRLPALPDGSPAPRLAAPARPAAGEQLCLLGEL